MSMLAEKRSKKKWCPNPNGKDWSNDDDKFGQRMLEKMGWKKGCGLGVNLQGMKEHVKVPAKNDTKGLGSTKTSDKEWIHHQQNYENLLSELSSTVSEGSSSTALNTSPVSLEEKSKKSRARVHYQKFTRGKDVSQYSPSDLASIFGKKSNSQDNKTIEINVHEDNSNNNSEIAGGSKLISYGTPTYNTNNVDNSKQLLPNSCKGEIVDGNVTDNNLSTMRENQKLNIKTYREDTGSRSENQNCVSKNRLLKNVDIPDTLKTVGDVNSESELNNNLKKEAKNKAVAVNLEEIAMNIGNIISIRKKRTKYVKVMGVSDTITIGADALNFMSKSDTNSSKRKAKDLADSNNDDENASNDHSYCKEENGSLITKELNGSFDDAEHKKIKKEKIKKRKQEDDLQINIEQEGASDGDKLKINSSFPESSAKVTQSVCLNEKFESSAYKKQNKTEKRKEENQQLDTNNEADEVVKEFVIKNVYYFLAENNITKDDVYIVNETGLKLSNLKSKKVNQTCNLIQFESIGDESDKIEGKAKMDKKITYTDLFSCTKPIFRIYEAKDKNSSDPDLKTIELQLIRPYIPPKTESEISVPQEEKKPKED